VYGLEIRNGFANTDDAEMNLPFDCNSIVLNEFPAIVNLEVFRGQCPCRCVHCPVGMVEPQKRMVRFGLGGMKLGLLRKIAMEIAEHPPAVLRVHSTGEPLLWPDLSEALAIIRDSGVSSWLFTSAITANHLLLREICQTMRVIEISVNSVCREDYLLTKGIDAFDIVVQNIRFMREVIVNQKSVRLIVSRVQSNDELADAAFVDYWQSSGLVDDVFIRSMHTYNNLIPGLSATPRENDFSDAWRHEPCLVHWARFNISSSGKAVVCFNELFKPEIHPDLVYGDVNELSIATIWSGEKMQAVRSAELSGDYSNPLIYDELPCKKCEFCQPLFGSKGVQTSEFQIEMQRRSMVSGGEEVRSC
jgi:MoaA/NifB/PqqE/SkfB family radical SAM enzyme